MARKLLEKAVVNVAAILHVHVNFRLIFVGGSYSFTTEEAYALFFLGRVAYGIGNGIRTTVCGHRLHHLWKENLKVQTLYMLSSRLGSAFSFALAGAVLDPLGMRKTIWIAVGLSCVSVFTSWIQSLVDSDDDLHVVHHYQTRWQASKGGLRNFASNVVTIYWFFAITYLLVFCIITTLTGNGAGLLAVRNENLFL